MDPQQKTKVALYARVSTGKQAEKDLSIPDQVKQLKDYAVAKGWEVTKVYIESGVSGREENRPQFQEMVAEAVKSTSGISAIVTLTTSRFFRDATKARVYKHKLAKAGVRVIATHQEVTDDPMGSFVEGIFELIDQYESDMNGFHTLRAMKENARQGYYNGARPKFGFMAYTNHEQTKS
jgi:DNA invertase Pin-like site-specific DNA recombinase